VTVARHSTWIGLSRRPGDYSSAAEAILWPDATGIDLTASRCLAVGSEPIRAGREWTIRIACYRGDADGTLSHLHLGIPRGSAAVVTLVLWDGASMAHQASVAATVDADGTAWAHTAALTLPSTLDPGRYDCALTIAWPAGETWTHCRGTVEALPPVPA
jgi:hypothetical protein